MRRVPLYKTVLCLQVEKFLLGDKVVVDAMLFARAGASRGVGHGQDEGVGVAVEQQAVQRALPDARGAGYDDWGPLRRKVRHGACDG